MKIDVTAPILGLDGLPLPSENGTTATLRTLIHGALLNALPDDAKMLDGTKKAHLFTLALKANEDVIDLKAEDITLIKQRIGMAYPPLAVGRAYEILDPPAKDDEMAGDTLHN